MFNIRKTLFPKFIKIIFILLILSLFSETALIAQVVVEPVKIGVLTKRGVQRCLEQWSPTAEYLTKEIPDYSFTIVPLGFDEIYPTVEKEEVEFILANPSFYVGLELLYGANRIATLKNLRLDKVTTVFGGTIFCKAEHKDFKHLSDIRGKKFMAVSEKSFGGWQMAWREFKEYGIDPHSDFADLSFGGTHDAVVYAVLNGEVDAGTVRTDVLERMASEGKINLDDFYIFHDHECPYKYTPFLHSTHLYPEWPFAKAEHTSDELAERIEIALLEMSLDSPAAKAAKCAGWTIPLNYQPVHDCLKYLHVAPYEDYGKVTLRDVIRQYLPWILGALISIALITLFSFYVTHLNSRLRTALEGQSKELVERKWAEEALRETSDYLENLINYANAPIIVWDKELKITRFNHAFEKLTGLETEDVIGSQFDILFPSQQREESMVLVRRTALGERWDAIEIPIIHVDGSVRIILWNSATLFAADGETVIAVVAQGQDITERKLAEEKLRESEERFRTIFNTAQDSIFIKNRNLKYTHVNQAMERLFELPASKLIGRSDMELFGEDAGMHVQEVDSRVLNGEIIEEEHTKPVKGSPVTFHVIKTPIRNSNGKIVGICGIARNITERRLSEEALENSEKRYHELFNSVMEGIAIIDENEIIQFCNPACASIFEVDSVMAIEGKCLLEYVPEHQKDLVLSQTKIRKKGLSSQYELEIVTARGNNKIILFSVTPRYDDNNNCIGSFNAIMDITETKQLQESAERAKRLEAAGKIAGQVAHDFNNLLGPLVAYPDFIRNEIPEDHMIIPLLNDMEHAALHMAEINQQLLTLGRRGHYSQVPLNLNKIILQVINQMKPLPKELVIEANLCENLMNIKAGSAQILRVILNLLNNAKDAVRNIGQLTIKTENIYIDARAGKHERVPMGEFVKLTISDNGCGISDEVYLRIFDPFFTTKTSDKKRGSGLGLSVVDAVVRDHNGYIDFDSTVGKGTSFYLYFPITREIIEDSFEGEIIGGTESILVIDDDMMQRNVTLKLLKNLGYKGDAAQSGEQAIELLKNRSYDLLLLDMIMPPGIDGTETLRKALEKNPSQKAIIVSGYSETERVEEALKLGAGAYIRKPLTLRTIAAAIRKELDKVEMQKSC